MNIKINNRLLKISDFIYQEDKVIDIGCDHGLLGIYLVLNKKVNKMISSDINEMPLKKAKENKDVKIKEYICMDDIEEDGIKKISDILKNGEKLLKKCPSTSWHNRHDFILY